MEIISFFKRYKSIILFVALAGAILYSPLIINGSSNSLDSLWTYPWYIAGTCELSVGRFFWSAIDLLKTGLVSTPFHALIYILVFSLAVSMIFRLFDIASTWISVLIGIFFISYPVICASLSYHFMIPCFSAAFLLAVVACTAIILLKSDVIAILSGACCIAFSMGCYQAYIGVVSMVLLFYFIHRLANTDKSFDMFSYIRRIILSILLGGLLYYILVHTALWLLNLVFHLDVELASYRGASGITLGAMIKELPQSIVLCYQDFFQYFFSNKIRNNAFGAFIINTMFMIMSTIFAGHMVIHIIRKDRLRGIFIFIGFLLMPIAANLIELIAVGNRINLLMSIGASLFLPLMSLSLFSYLKNKKIWRICIATIMCLSIYTNTNEVVNDQISMEYGRNQTMAVADCIYDRLMEIEDIQNNQVFIYGQAADSPLFAHTAWYDTANAYARYGYFIRDEANISSSWPNILRLRYGNFTNYLREDDYADFMTEHAAEIISMPLLPSSGSIKEIDGVIVVKVAAEY